jgi:hypothetical protein
MVGPASRLESLDFPGEGMVAGELLDPVASNPVRSAVSHVPNERAAWQEREGRAGRAHATEFRRPFALPVNQFVGLPDARQKSQRWRLRGKPLVRLRHRLHGQVAGCFPGGVSPHPVSHDEQPPGAPKLLPAPGGENREGILVLVPPQADVGDVTVFEGGA